uniref:Uncharacterized protein n=1 Tax=Anguilla anguilla TaxID=7936 RepID=A0A0E9TN83_ANGAN
MFLPSFCCRCLYH